MDKETFPWLRHRLSGCDLLVFFDFEATEYTHRAIALGIVGYAKEPGTLLPLKEKFRYKRLIRTKDTIGSLVERMTGITPERLDAEGIPFSDCLKEVIDLCRESRSKAYLSYSFMDMKILEASIGKEPFEKDFVNHVRKCYVDLHAYLSRFLVDDRGQSLSVKKLLKRLGIDMEGMCHDPFFDALALAKIYGSVVADEERLLRETFSNYRGNRRLDDVEHRLVQKLIERGEVRLEDFKALLEEKL